MKKQWQAEVSDLYAFHKEMIRTYGKSQRGRPRNGIKNGWGIRETAKARNLPIGKVCEDIQIAEALISRPKELSECKDREEALIKSRRREKID